MKSIRFVFAMLATLTLSACYPPVTTAPIGTTAGTNYDPDVTGTWKSTGEDGRATYLHFLAGPEEMAVLVPASGVKSDLIIVTFTIARFGGAGFMNVRFATSDGEPIKDQPAGTIPVHYRIDAGNMLTLALMNEDAVKAAVRAHTLNGTIGPGDSGDVTITEEPAALDKFMASPAAARLFSIPFLTLHKVD